MGRFTGAANQLGLGAKNFFGLKRTPAPSGFVIQAAAGSVQGFSAAIVGWNGASGTIGPSFTGSVISGPAAVWGPIAIFGFGDGDAGGFGGIALPPPYFAVYDGGLRNQNFFASVKLNGHTYLTSALDFFTNMGGCGPTLWAWQTIAGLIAGHQYPVVFS